MTTAARPWTRLTARRSRLVVLLVGLAVFLPKLLIAIGTFGTQDIRTWVAFAQGVSQQGPVGIYRIDFESLREMVYNHPPLVGYYLELVNGLAEWGVPVKVTIRAVSSAADVVSGLLVFEILRRRASLSRATISGVAVAASPMLFLVSGYHGNTDPLFLMLVLLGAFLIIDKRKALLGGVALGLAIGVKLVPVVVLPTIAVYLLRHRRDLLVRGAAGFAVTFALTWGWAILHEWNGLRRNVLGYGGVHDRPWGLVRIIDDLGWSTATEFMIGPGKFVVVLLCALIPAALTWLRPQIAMESVAMSLVGFLILSPAFGVQYLAWAVAAAYLLDLWSAMLYNILGGLLLYQVYDQWNSGLPWTEMALGHRFTPDQRAWAGILWIALIAVLVIGVYRALSKQVCRPLR